VPEDIPLQDNGSDCGVFTCKFADYLGERLDLTFSAEDMPYFRRRLLVDLLADHSE
jgi:Ulp1 family protease